MPTTTVGALSFVLFLSFVAIGVLIGQSGLDFAWKIIIATGMIIFGHQMTTFKLPGSTTTNWPNYIRFYGWTTMLAILLFSNIGWRGRTVLNTIDQIAKTGSLYRCPDEPVVVPGLNDGHVLVSVSRGCKFYVDYSNAFSTPEQSLWTWTQFENGKRYSIETGSKTITLDAPDFLTFSKQPQWITHRDNNGKDRKIWGSSVTANDKVFDAVGVDVIHVLIFTVTEEEAQRRIANKG